GVIIVTDYAKIDSSISALRKGAYDYLVKPINIAEVKREDQITSERKRSFSLLSSQGSNFNHRNIQ
ncbi:MAG: hypothetical protein SV775_18310, partial [Thermodesulfobacteriota bacterium]|nr:hypothetical protein [Thermodesulfobacteriota bacterium]